MRQGCPLSSNVATLAREAEFSEPTLENEFFNTIDPKRTCSALGVCQLQWPNVRAADMDQRELIAATDLSRASVYRALAR